MQAKFNFIIPLADPSAELALVGGKGASLARLAAAGLPVPAGFHVTTLAYKLYVEANHLETEITSALATIDPGATSSTTSRACSPARCFRDGRRHRGHRARGVPPRRLEALGRHVVRQAAGPVMKAKELRQKDAGELKEELLKLRREQFNLRMAQATGQAVKPDQAGKVRRNIARVKTVLGEQSRGAANKGSK